MAANSAFAELKTAYEQRYAALQSAKAQRQATVGYVGAAFPRELAWAAGTLPIAITPQAGRPTPNADHYIEPVVSAETRELFEAALLGELSDVDLLVITRPFAKLYYYLKEIYRQGRAPRMPALHMFDLMQSRREAVRAYNEGQLRDLSQAISRIAHQPLDEEAIAAASVVAQRIREAQRKLLDLRWRQALTGVDALIALGAGCFMPPHDYLLALERYVGSLAPDAMRDRPRWLVTASEPLSNVRLHAVLEEAGGLVIAEDDAWGSRAPGQDSPAHLSTQQSILHRACFDSATGHEWPPELRESWFAMHIARPEIDGVVFYIPPSDRQFGWDYPRLRTTSEQAGKRTLLIRENVQTDRGRDDIRRQATAFRETCMPGAVMT